MKQDKNIALSRVDRGWSRMEGVLDYKLPIKKDYDRRILFWFLAFAVGLISLIALYIAFKPEPLTKVPDTKNYAQVDPKLNELNGHESVKERQAIITEMILPSSSEGQAVPNKSSIQEKIAVAAFEDESSRANHVLIDQASGIQDVAKEEIVIELEPKTYADAETVSLKEPQQSILSPVSLLPESDMAIEELTLLKPLSKLTSYSTVLFERKSLSFNKTELLPVLSGDSDLIRAHRFANKVFAGALSLAYVPALEGVGFSSGISYSSNFDRIGYSVKLVGSYVNTKYFQKRDFILENEAIRVVDIDNNASAEDQAGALAGADGMQADQEVNTLNFDFGSMFYIGSGLELTLFSSKINPFIGVGLEYYLNTPSNASGLNNNAPSFIGSENNLTNYNKLVPYAELGLRSQRLGNISFQMTYKYSLRDYISIDQTALRPSAFNAGINVYF